MTTILLGLESRPGLVKSCFASAVILSIKAGLFWGVPTALPPPPGTGTGTGTAGTTGTNGMSVVKDSINSHSKQHPVRTQHHTRNIAHPILTKHAQHKATLPPPVLLGCACYYSNFTNT